MGQVMGQKTCCCPEMKPGESTREFHLAMKRDVTADINE